MQEASEQRTTRKETSVCMRRPENKRGSRAEPGRWGDRTAQRERAVMCRARR